MIAVIAGGVGAARFLAGLVQVVEPRSVTAIVNVGDDLDLHGLHVSPDLDTVTYTLAGQINPETGWGRAGETWQVMAALEELGGQSWFRLGDHDLATHLYRTQRLAEGAPLSTVTTELAERFGVAVRVVPATDDRLRTLVHLRDPPVGTDPTVDFQSWFVGMRHEPPVAAVTFDGALTARPAPGVLDALATAEVIVLAPSNPVVSIEPVLAVPGIRDAVADRRERVVAVSPLVAGRALKGPADRLLADLGAEPSVVGVADRYRELIAALVIDPADAALVGGVEATGVHAIVTPAVMTGPAEAAALAHAAVAAVRSSAPGSP